MSNNPRAPREDGFEEEELIRREFDSIVSGLSLNEASTSTYLDDLDRIDQGAGFVAPNPPRQSPRSFLYSAKRAVVRWFQRGYREDDGVEI